VRESASEKAIGIQASEIYIGIDCWQDWLIKKGEFLVQFDQRPKDVIENSLNTRSLYFSNPETLEKCKNEQNQLSGQKYGEMVQVFPREISKENGQRQYAGNIVIYRVEKPIHAAKSIAEHNPLYGEGGGDQFYLPINKDELLKQGFLKRVEVLPTVDREHNLEWLKDFENKGYNRDQIEAKLPDLHHELVQSWLHGTPEQREKAEGILAMEREAERLKLEAGIEPSPTGIADVAPIGTGTEILVSEIESTGFSAPEPGLEMEL